MYTDSVVFEIFRGCIVWLTIWAICLAGFAEILLVLLNLSLIFLDTEGGQIHFKISSG